MMRARRHQVLIELWKSCLHFIQATLGKSHSLMLYMCLCCVYCGAFSREDFRALMREVRRMNNNTLSGLSMDAIIHQVRPIADGTLKEGTFLQQKLVFWFHVCSTAISCSGTWNSSSMPHKLLLCFYS